MTKRGMSLWNLALGLTVAFAFLATSPTKVIAADVPEVVTIKVGGVLTMTGGGAQWHGPGAEAEKVFFKNLNETGGIAYREPDGTTHRFKVEHKYEDCAYQPKKAVSSYVRLRDWGAHLITTDGTTPGSALYGLATRDGVPVLHKFACVPDPEGNGDINKKKYWLPNHEINYACCLTTLMAFKKGVWEKDHPGKPLKVGIVSLDNPTRRMYAQPKVKELYSRAGIELVGVAFVPISVTDVTIQVKQFYDKGARTILIDHITSAAKVTIENAERLGIKDEMSFIGWYTLLKDFLSDPEVFDGFYNQYMAPAFNVKKRSPEVERVGKIYQAANPKYWKYMEDRAIDVHHSLTVGMQAVKHCLEKHGYKGFNRETLRDSMFSLRDIDTGIHPRFSIDPQYPLTTPYDWLYRVDAKNKCYVPIGPVVAAGPHMFRSRWNPSDDPKVVLTHYYQWP